jgi:monofunctional glycosyltransferase
VVLDEIDPFFLQAVVAVEDRRFYQRQGLDFRSLGRAMWTNLKNFDLLEGGSTIGQQVGKNLYFDFRFNVLRKIAEVFLLYDIEKTITKDETLELYVNMNYYGDGYIGIKRASMGYFDRLPSELTLGQASFIGRTATVSITLSIKQLLSTGENPSEKKCWGTWSNWD